MRVTDSQGSDIASLEQWREKVFDTPSKRRHWKERRSAYSIADFILNCNGAAILESRISSVLSQPVTFDLCVPEMRARFDQYGGPAQLDLGISGKTGSGGSLFVGLEAKVDETFGSTVCQRYEDAIGKRNRGKATNAPERIEGLLSQYFSDTTPPCDSRFSDIRYQLLTATAGTVAAKKDVSVFFVAVFKTRLYDEGKGLENRQDYENFIIRAGGTRLASSVEICPAHELVLGGMRLVCMHEIFDTQS